MKFFFTFEKIFKNSFFDALNLSLPKKVAPLRTRYLPFKDSERQILTHFIAITLPAIA